MADTSTAYPVNLSIDYPDRELNRFTTFLRIVVIIPIAIILVLLAGPVLQRDATHQQQFGHITYGIVILPIVLMLLFRQKYPKWWFDWNVALVGFCTRVWVYLALLRDEYPSTDEEQAVHIEIQYPDAKQDLNRWLPLVKWLLAIPHYIVLCFVAIAATICVIVAWFAILFTGRYPRTLFDFVVGAFRWSLRVGAYMFLLTTDRYPPFQLSE
jgi:hypothetical protein